MDVNRFRGSSVDFSAIPDRSRADSAPAPVYADPVEAARASARMITPRPSAQERARQTQAGELRSTLRDWNEQGPPGEWAARLSVEGRVLQAFARGENRVDLPSEYSDVQLPTNLRNTFGITIFVAPEEPREQVPLPQPQIRVSVPVGDVFNPKVKAEGLIASLGKISSAEAVERSAETTLKFIDASVADPNEKLDLYWQMVTRLNAVHVDSPEFAGKIFVEQLTGRANQLELDIVAMAPLTPQQDSTLRRLFFAMEGPTIAYLPPDN